MRLSSFSTFCSGVVLGNLLIPLASAQDDCLPTWGSVSYSRFTNDLITFDAGFGVQLYATQSGGLSRWDGATWSPAGVAAGSTGGIFRMHRVQTDSGLRLWSLGRTGIWESNGDSLVRIAQLNGTIFDLVQADFGAGLQTFVSSETRVFRRDQDAWAPIAQFTYFSCINSCLAVYDDGTGPTLFVAGSFDRINGQPASRIARLDDGWWTEVGGGINDGVLCGPNAQVLSMVTFDDGNGSKLYVGGAFSSAGGVPVGGLACWDGTSWATVGGASEPGNVVSGLRILANRRRTGAKHRRLGWSFLAASRRRNEHGRSIRCLVRSDV